ncbi:MAG: sulfurtransferase [Reichenbachiella sp.]|uniref:sulfurtransferase n=1 Tax=Reichenbachiella sp. TaxID=2184521 RepID=UPI0032658EF5
MKSITILSFTAGLLFLLADLSYGQDIISAADLAQIIKSDQVVVVSARKAEDYKKVHITGAIHLDHKSLYKEKSMLQDPSQIATILGNKGISDQMKIVVYDNGSAKYAGRIYWILKYLGAKDVKMLDGGMKAWRMARKPVTKNPTTGKKARFNPVVDKSSFASMSQVKQASKNPAYVLVDVRSVEEYNGTAQTKLRPGHVPKAVNLNYKEVLTAQGTLKSNAELAPIFANVGITKNKEIILYCESSVRAGIVYLALKSALKYPKVRVYDGAYLEWESFKENKIEVAP